MIIVVVSNGRKRSTGRRKQNMSSCRHGSKTRGCIERFRELRVARTGSFHGLVRS